MDREDIEEAIEVLEDASAEMLTETGNENYYDEAIAILRQALVDADDTSQERVDEMVKTEHDRAVELGKAYERGWNAALAQQEPVAWISDSPTKGNGKQLHWTKSDAWRWSSNITPLYTAPPKREWVGLTDQEVMVAAYQAGFDIHEDYENEDDPEAMHWWTPDGEAGDDSLLKLRDLIEAKLKEKNT